MRIAPSAREQTRSDVARYRRRHPEHSSPPAPATITPTGSLAAQETKFIVGE